MSSRAPILVVGGGLGGLTTALALARRSRPVRVLEGAREFGAIGYGIQFGPNVFHVFDRLGLMEQVLAVADSPEAVVMRDALDGKELLRLPTGAILRKRFKYPYIILHRIDLHNVLLDACRRSDAIELVDSASMADFEDRGDDVRVVTADGRSFSGERSIHLKLFSAELDHARSGDEATSRGQCRRHLERRAEAELVRVVGVAYPCNATLFNDFQAIGHRLERPHRRHDEIRIDAERGRQGKDPCQIQDYRLAE